MLRVSLALACVLAVAGAALGQEGDRRQKADLAAFQDFLKTQYKGRKWQTGPSPIETPELKQTFPKLRFYYVFSAPPAQEGDLVAQLKRLREETLKRREEERRREEEEIKREEQGLKPAPKQPPAKEEREQMLSLTVAVDERGKVTRLAAPADFRQLLPPVGSHAEARSTAALILTLHAPGTRPTRVRAEEVSAVRDGNGWSCTAGGREAGYSGGVQFNPEGEIISISKHAFRAEPPR